MRTTKQRSQTQKLKWVVVASLAAMLAFAGRAPAQQHFTLTNHVPRAVASRQAEWVGELPGTHRLSLAVSLPLHHEVELDDLLQQLYDPESPDFRQYLTVEEFTERFGPTQEEYDALLNFAEANGLTVVGSPSNRLVLDLEGPVEGIEKAFNVTMGVYQHPTENRTFYAPDREPTLELETPVLHISGLDNFTLPHAKRSLASQTLGGTKATTAATGSGPNGQFIGSDLRTAYYGSGSLTGAGQSVGLFEFGGYSISDVQTYFKNVNQNLNVPVVGVSLNGVAVACTKCEDSEQVLDIEIAISMAPGLKQVVVYVGSSDVSIFNQMAADNTSKQLSCSWGWKDDESSLDPIFKEFAAQGQSVFVASGDQGSNTVAGEVWPADDPYVTAVGGTDLTTNGAGGAWKSETGWSGSAGMPSKNNIPIPSYQLLAGVVTASNKASTALRNVPDVAAESNTNQYSCWDGSCSGGNGGTSYAAPQWAAFTALVNQQAAADGKPPVGFLNPTLYKIALGSSFSTNFHDITGGSNGKYSAVTRFDLVTGWGSFIGPNLLNAILALE